MALVKDRLCGAKERMKLRGETEGETACRLRMWESWRDDEMGKKAKLKPRHSSGGSEQKGSFIGKLSWAAEKPG